MRLSQAKEILSREKKQPAGDQVPTLPVAPAVGEHSSRKRLREYLSGGADAGAATGSKEAERSKKVKLQEIKLTPATQFCLDMPGSKPAPKINATAAAPKIKATAAATQSTKATALPQETLAPARPLPQPAPAQQVPAPAMPLPPPSQQRQDALAPVLGDALQLTQAGDSALATQGTQPAADGELGNYSAQYARFRRRMKRADLPQNLKAKMLTCEGRKDLWKLFQGKEEDVNEMSSHLLVISLRQSQEQSRRHAWTTRSSLEAQLGVQDTDTVFALARQQGRWRAHPSAPGVRQLEQVYFLVDEAGSAVRTDATEVTSQAEVSGALAGDIVAGNTGLPITNQPTSQPTSQAINQPSNQPTNQQTNKQ